MSRRTYKWKRDHAGEVAQRKARVVIQGFSQEFGLGSFEAFTLVAKVWSARLYLAVRGRSRGLHQLGVVVVAFFLETDVGELATAEQPEGYAPKGLNKGRAVCRLSKPLV